MLSLVSFRRDQLRLLMSRLISNPEYQKVIADFTPRRNDLHDPLRTYKNEYQRSCDLIVNTTGISALSVLFYLLEENDQPQNWNHEHYDIFVSHTAGDQIADDLYSYYNTFVAPEKNWIFLRSVDLGVENICTNSWAEGSVGSEASILHFKFCKFSVNIDAAGNEGLDGKKIMMISGSR
jgi:hypothetical protein